MKPFHLIAAITLLALTACHSDPIQATEAAQRVGQEVTVKDLCTNVTTSKHGNLFLTFGPKYPHETFTVFIPAKFAPLFDNPTKYVATEVTITGTVVSYKGKPEIVVTERKQIKITNPTP